MLPKLNLRGWSSKLSEERKQRRAGPDYEGGEGFGPVWVHIQKLAEGEYFVNEGLSPPSKLILGTSNRIFELELNGGSPKIPFPIAVPAHFTTGELPVG